MTGEAPYDICVIGGGINGAGIARDAAGRGYNVVLCEQGDLASATSSASTKLIHGGLRYLEFYEFRLVREALIEREVLLRAAPHIIWPLRFVLPHSREQRPAWMIRIGLFLYDHLGGRELLPGSRGIDLANHPAGGPLRPDYRKAFVYSDCWVQDSRLVVLNALDAAERGAEILTRTQCVSAARRDGLWEVELRDADTTEVRRVRARALVNAAGPWVADVLARRLGRNADQRVRLVKGSHIVVPKLFDHDQAYIFQNDDKRIVFAIPYEDDFTLIGTTELDYEGDPAEAAITAAETDYLVKAIARYFKVPVAAEDVVSSYSGVRPLFDDGATSATAATRDYVLELEAAQGEAPLLNVFGGKITTYRRLAEQALAKLARVLDHDDKPWTADASLPGGDIADADFEAFLGAFCRAHPWLPEDLARRYARSYGTRAERLIGEAKSLADLGTDFGGGLYEAEATYLWRHEWARAADDILWRRSKLGLRATAETRGALEDWLTRRKPIRSDGQNKAKRVAGS